MMNKKQKEQVKKLLPVVGIAGVAGIAYYVMRSRRAAQGDFQPMATGGRNRRNRTQNSSTAFNPTADWSATNSSSNTERRLTFRLSADQISALQRKVGVRPDSKWGMQTEAAFQRAAAADNLPLQIDEPTLTAWLQGRPTGSAASSSRPATGTATGDNALVDAKRMHDNIFTNRRLNEAQKMQQAFLYLRGKSAAYRRMIQSSYDRTFGTSVNPSFRRRLQTILNNAPNGAPNKMEFSKIVNALA